MWKTPKAVSYTHLDVYKRQCRESRDLCLKCWNFRSASGNFLSSLLLKKSLYECFLKKKKSKKCFTQLITQLCTTWRAAAAASPSHPVFHYICTCPLTGASHMCVLSCLFVLFMRVLDWKIGVFLPFHSWIFLPSISIDFPPSDCQRISEQKVSTHLFTQSLFL